MKIQGFIGATDWGIQRVSFRLEGFNGFGYHAHGVHSPYLYGGSTVYGPPEARGGKYVADHDFNPRVTDSQLGTLTILKQLEKLDDTIRVVPLPPAPQPDDHVGAGVLWVQEALNALELPDPPLVEDGVAGKQTMKWTDAFQQSQRLPRTGLADQATIGALENELEAKSIVKATLPQRTVAMMHSNYSKEMAA
jgi:hypothetical protein